MCAKPSTAAMISSSGHTKPINGEDAMASLRRKRQTVALIVHERICPPPGGYADLDDIWKYIADDNLDAADRVREEIFQTIHSLVAFPHQGTNAPT